MALRGYLRKEGGIGIVAGMLNFVSTLRAHPEDKGTMAPVYGMAGTVPFRGLLSDLLKKYMDLIYKV